MVRRRPVILARIVLVWERAAPVLAAPLGALGLYLALALFGLFERFGDPLRALVLLTLLIAAGWLTARAARGFRWPSIKDAERRVEADSGLKDREYEALRDRPSAGDDAMWQAHRARMQQRLAAARTRRPRAAWAVLDPYGLRISLVLVILAGIFLAGDLARYRAGDAFSLRPLTGGAERAIADLWVEPPAYTGEPTLYLRERRAAEVPQGSILAARLAGTRRTPSVRGAEAEIERIDETVWQIRAPLTRSGEIVVRAGPLAERLDLTLIPDMPPRLALASEPEGDAEGRLQLEFLAEDDYAVEAFALDIAPEPAARGGEIAEDAWDRVAIPAGAVNSAGEANRYAASIEVARHRLAGERVAIRLAGTDGAGQTGVSARYEMTLPERVFLDPLARAVAYERKGFLAAEGEYAPVTSPAPEPVSGPGQLGSIILLDDEPGERIERAPDGVQRLALALDALSDAPAPYFDDPLVYMGLRTAMHEVRRARGADALSHLEEDLWQIALRAELGTLADARAALEAAEQALNDAMARGADAQELAPLFDAYDRAMQNYLAALAREALTEERTAGGGGGGMNSMNADMLQELLDALREAAELGDTEGARRALAQLQELLRNLQMTLGGGGGGGQGDSPMARALREALEELGEQIGEQRELMDETFDEAQGRNGEPEGSGNQPGQAGEPGTPGGDEPGGDEPGISGPYTIGPDGEERPLGGSEGEPGEQGQGGGGLTREELARRQGALAGRLGEMEGAVTSEEAQEALGRAGEAMDEAAQALREGELEGALNLQNEAIAAMREAAGELAERLLAEEGGQETDPLGRGTGGTGPGDVEVPSEAERQRAREILEELRRRAAEQGRPQEELDYIERLLERF